MSIHRVNVAKTKAQFAMGTSATSLTGTLVFELTAVKMGTAQTCIRGAVNTIADIISSAAGIATDMISPTSIVTLFGLLLDY